MADNWDYRYEFKDFKRHSDGSCSYRTRSQGRVNTGSNEPFANSIIMFEAWGKARKESLRTGQNVVAYVKGDQVRVEPLEAA